MHRNSAMQMFLNIFISIKSIKSCYENCFLHPQKIVLCKFVLWEIVLAEGWLYYNYLIFIAKKMFDFSGLCGKWCFERAWTLVTHRPKSSLRPRPQLLPRLNRQAQEVIRPKKSFLIMVTSLGRPKHRRSIGQLSVTNFRFRKTYPDCRGIIDRQTDNTHLPTTAEV